MTDIKSLIDRAEQALKTPSAYETLCYLVPELIAALREQSSERDGYREKYAQAIVREAHLKVERDRLAKRLQEIEDL